LIKELKYLGFLIIVLLLLSVFDCVGKPPENDVALIKELLVKFEKGLKEKNVTVLDSVMDKKQKDLSSKLITDFSAWGEIKNAYIANKSFTIVEDSAKVELKLNMEVLKSGEGLKKFGKSVNLFLDKKRGKWRIKTYEIMTND
jgi:GTPase involved in cell partitioning and DNA repair